MIGYVTTGSCDIELHVIIILSHYNDHYLLLLCKIGCAETSLTG